ncbi:uncharacterized protein V1516DRAFT_679415 [Lipomyces oligophaga]|uniref:uncharacterized protein n=1 Tax=Lipomyces oligophaga TaxID=45792 RepID=UPI0034CE5398
MERAQMSIILRATRRPPCNFKLPFQYLHGRRRDQWQIIRAYRPVAKGTMSFAQLLASYEKTAGHRNQGQASSEKSQSNGNDTSSNRPWLKKQPNNDLSNPFNVLKVQSQSPGAQVHSKVDSLFVSTRKKNNSKKSRISFSARLADLHLEKLRLSRQRAYNMAKQLEKSKPNPSGVSTSDSNLADSNWLRAGSISNPDGTLKSDFVNNALFDIQTDSSGSLSDSRKEYKSSKFSRQKSSLAKREWVFEKSTVEALQVDDDNICEFIDLRGNVHENMAIKDAKAMLLDGHALVVVKRGADGHRMIVRAMERLVGSQKPTRKEEYDEDSEAVESTSPQINDKEDAEDNEYDFEQVVIVEDNSAYNKPQKSAKPILADKTSKFSRKFKSDISKSESVFDSTPESSSGTRSASTSQFASKSLANSANTISNSDLAFGSIPSNDLDQDNRKISKDIKVVELKWSISEQDLKRQKARTMAKHLKKGNQLRIVLTNGRRRSSSPLENDDKDQIIALVESICADAGGRFVRRIDEPNSDAVSLIFRP